MKKKRESKPPTPCIKMDISYAGEVRTDSSYLNGGDLDIESITVTVLEGQVEFRQGNGTIDLLGPGSTWTVKPKLRVVPA